MNAAAGASNIAEVSPGSHINSWVRNIVRELPDAGIVFETANPVIAKLASLQLVGRQTSFPARDYFVSGRILREGVRQPESCDEPIGYPSGMLPKDLAVWSGACDALQEASFDMHSADGSTVNHFIVNSLGAGDVTMSRCNVR